MPDFESLPEDFKRFLAECYIYAVWKFTNDEIEMAMKGSATEEPKGLINTDDLI